MVDVPCDRHTYFTSMNYISSYAEFYYFLKSVKCGVLLISYFKCKLIF